MKSSKKRARKILREDDDVTSISEAVKKLNQIRAMEELTKIEQDRNRYE